MQLLPKLLVIGLILSGVLLLYSFYIEKKKRKQQPMQQPISKKQKQNNKKVFEKRVDMQHLYTNERPMQQKPNQSVKPNQAKPNQPNQKLVKPINKSKKSPSTYIITGEQEKIK